MAAGRLPAPGTELGPCDPPTCIHRDCAETRRMAESACVSCGEPIGYEVRFYDHQRGELAPGGGIRTGLAHAECLEAAVDRERAAATRCADCGLPGERTGHMGCQFPGYSGAQS